MDYDYKDGIRATRKGCLGGSDAKMMAQISLLGDVPKSAYKRLAIVKGLIDYDEIPTTRAMAFGDFVENEIYDMLVMNDGESEWESNPLWVSKKYSKKNVSLICHPDIVRYDGDSQTLYVYECKATQETPEETKQTYRSQIFIERVIAQEIAQGIGKKVHVKNLLVHYDTKGLDLEKEFEFDASRLSIHEVRFQSHVFDIEKAMMIIDDFLEGFDMYSEDDEIESKYLPERVRQEFDTVTNMIVEIKEREQRVNEFKDKLYAFMVEKNIKSIKNDTWNITRVDATEAVSFDSKRFLDDYARKYPRKAKKLVMDYEKRSKRKGYVNIKLKNNVKD